MEDKRSSTGNMADADSGQSEGSYVEVGAFFVELLIVIVIVVGIFAGAWLVFVRVANESDVAISCGGFLTAVTEPLPDPNTLDAKRHEFLGAARAKGLPEGSVCLATGVLECETECTDQSNLSIEGLSWEFCDKINQTAAKDLIKSYYPYGQAPGSVVFLFVACNKEGPLNAIVKVGTFEPKQPIYY